MCREIYQIVISITAIFSGHDRLLGTNQNSCYRSIDFVKKFLNICISLQGSPDAICFDLEDPTVYFHRSAQVNFLYL